MSINLPYKKKGENISFSQPTQDACWVNHSVKYYDASFLYCSANCVILLFRAHVERTGHNLVVPSENDLLLDIGDDDADAGADADLECADCKEAIDHKSRVLNNINRQEYRRDRNENGHRSYAEGSATA